MSKMIGGIAFLFVVILILGATMNGGGGINTTRLTGNISATAVVIPVQSTSGFLSPDYVVIGGEKILYTGKTATTFTGATRPTGATTHSSGAMVYSPQTSILNNALGFNVGAVGSTVGLFAVIVVPVKFFTTTLPNIVTIVQDLPGAAGDFAFIGYLVLAVLIGIVISLAIALIWVASGIVGKLTG